MQTITRLAERIHGDRRRAGLTQGQVAEAMSTSEQTVSRQLVGRWEAGTSIPDAVQLVRLAHLFGTSVADLYGAAEDDLTAIDLRESASGWSHERVTEPTLFDEPSDPHLGDLVIDLTAEEVTARPYPRAPVPCAA